MQVCDLSHSGYQGTMSVLQVEPAIHQCQTGSKLFFIYIYNFFLFFFYLQQARLLAVQAGGGGGADLAQRVHADAGRLGGRRAQDGHHAGRVAHDRLPGGHRRVQRRAVRVRTCQLVLRRSVPLS